MHYEEVQRTNWHHNMASEANLAEAVNYTLDQRLNCIYDDEPLGFKKDPVVSTEKILGWDPLVEVDLGDGSIKRPMYINAKIDPSFKDHVVKLRKD